MSESVDGLAARLEGYRAYLGLLGRLQVSRGLQGKVDVSGIVQQTLWEAHRELLDQPLGSTVDFAAFLRKVLSRNLLDEARKAQADKRDVRRERSLEAELEESSARLEEVLAADHSSVGERLGRQEDLVRLARALDALNEAQREAIERHYLLGWPLAKIAGEMGRSKPSVAGLLQRGLEALRTQLK